MAIRRRSRFRPDVPYCIAIPASTLAGSCLLLVSTLAWGQFAPEATLPEVRVQGQAERAEGPVTGYRATRSGTATRTDTPLNEVPASISVVPAQVMQDTAMQSMGDVFRYVPGVLTHQGEGNRDQMVIRGNSTNSDFYVDGVRDDAQVFRDLYNLERVELLKGPAGMIFGRGSAGGVVNRVTKRPAFESMDTANLTLGSFGQRRATIDVGDKFNDTAAWRLNAMSETADSFRSGVTLDRFALNPTASFVLGDQTLLTVGFEFLSDSRTADRGFPSFNGAPLSASTSTFFGNASQSRARSSVEGGYAVIEHDMGDGMQLKNTLRVTHYDKFYQNVYAGSAVAANGTLTLSAYNNANQRTNLFNQTDLTRKFTAGGMEHTLLAGMELGSQDSYSKRNTGFFGPGGSAIGATVNAANPIAVATVFRPNGTDADNQVNSTTAAVYVQDQVAITKTWKLVAGLRYDRFKLNFDDRRTTTPAVDLARTDTAFSPRAGVIWSPNAGTSYYASYSFAFLPSGETLSLATTTADLAPEKAKNLEVGARWDVAANLTLAAALYRNDRLNVRVADPVNAGLFVKSGQQRTDGIEVSLQGDVTRHWQVYGAYSHMDGRVLQPVSSGTTASVATIFPAGTRIGLVPQNTASLWNKFDLGGNWGTGLGLIHQSSSYTSFTNTVTLPAFSRVDGAVFYALGPKSRLSFNVENLLNKSYFPTVDGDNNISPGAPRNARLTLTIAF